MRTILCIAAVAATLTTSLTWPTATYASVETCRGETATVVGVEDQKLVGTEGDDVIVTNGASFAYALGGDDLICATRTYTNIDAGQGDDFVDASTARFGSDADLGAGSDTYVGSDEYDRVDAGDDNDVRQGNMPGVDVIDTFGDGDFVDVGARGQVGTDQVRLGEGRDWVEVRGTTPAVLDGAGGRDTIFLRDREAAGYRIDAASGIVTRDGVPMTPVAGFAIWDVGRLRWSSLHFEGGPGSDRLDAIKGGWKVKDGPLTANLGAGRDSLQVRLGNTGPFDGGEGRDRIEVRNENNRSLGGPFVADLTQDTYRFEDDSPVGIPGFEDLYAFTFDSGTIVGDAGPNKIAAAGCPMVIRGGAGNDNLRGSAGKDCQVDGPARGSTLYGEAGDDTLAGSGLADRLFGGPGRDKAYGGSGRDRCVAETRFECEL